MISEIPGYWRTHNLDEEEAVKCLGNELFTHAILAYSQKHEEKHASALILLNIELGDSCLPSSRGIAEWVSTRIDAQNGRLL